MRAALGFGWLLWRRARLGYASALASAALAYAMGRTPFAVYALPVGAVSFTLAAFALLAALSFAETTDLAALASGYPRYLLLLPVRNRTLVAWPMFLGACALASAWIVFAGVALAPRFGPIAVVLPALGLAALLACLQAAAWVPLPLPFLRSGLVLLSVGGLALWGMLAVYDFVSPAVVGAGYGAAGAVAFLGATGGLARARRGETVEWKPAERRRSSAPEAPVRRPFRSPMEAQVWIESRRNGLALPVMSAFMALPTPLAALLPGGRPPITLGPVEIDPSLAIYLLPPVFIAFLSGFDGGCASVRDNFREDSSLIPLLATRPLSDAALIEAKLRMAVRAVGRSGAVLALGPLLLLLSPVRVAGVPATVGATLAAHATVRGVGLVLLAIALLGFLAWRGIVGALWLRFSYRAWLRNGAGFGLPAFAIFAAQVAYVRFHDDPSLPPLLARTALPVLAALATLKTVAALAAARSVRHRGLVADRVLVRWSLVAFSAGACVFAALRWLAPSLPLSAPELALVLFLLVPLVRVQLAVLTLHENRHR